MNRAERRATLAMARRRRSWTWETGPALHMPAWGRELPSWRNDLYAVMMYERDTPIGVVTHLAIRNHTGERDIPWADMQRIKRELLGDDREAVQVFPRESDVVDEANMYHLWILPADYALPFGLHVMADR